MDSLVLLISVVIFAVIVMAVLSKLSFSSGLNKKFYTNKWQDIEKNYMKSPTEAKMAIIEADKLLDHALKAKGYKGETMGERMKAAKYGDNIWSAHKLRNKLVHEQDVKLSTRQTKSAIKTYKQSLKNLGAL